MATFDPRTIMACNAHAHATQQTRSTVGIDYAGPLPTIPGLTGFHGVQSAVSSQVALRAQRRTVNLCILENTPNSSAQTVNSFTRPSTVSECLQQSLQFSPTINDLSQTEDFEKLVAETASALPPNEVNFKAIESEMLSRAPISMHSSGCERNSVQSSAPQVLQNMQHHATASATEPTSTTRLKRKRGRLTSRSTMTQYGHYFDNHQLIPGEGPHSRTNSEPVRKVVDQVAYLTPTPSDPGLTAPALAEREIALEQAVMNVDPVTPLTPTPSNPGPTIPALAGKGISLEPSGMNESSAVPSTPTPSAPKRKPRYFYWVSPNGILMQFLRIGNTRKALMTSAQASVILAAYTARLDCAPSVYPAEISMHGQEIDDCADAGFEVINGCDFVPNKRVKRCRWVPEQTRQAFDYEQRMTDTRHRYPSESLSKRFEG